MYRTILTEQSTQWCAALCAITLLLTLPAAHSAAAQPLNLVSAIEMAIDADPWLVGSEQTELALTEEAVAAGSLPDPSLSLTAINLPLTSFDIGQENMTQMAVGLNQQFPRGRTRALSRQQKETLAAVEPLRRADRIAALTTSVSILFLDAYLAQASRQLIEADRDLFEQLVDAAEAQYTSASGRARQQDLIRAQLELTRLDDRLTRLHQEQEVAQQRLAELVPASGHLPIDAVMPNLGTEASSRLASGPGTSAVLYVQMETHPAVLAVNGRIDAVATGTDLARQKYRPGWGLRAQYGYRADDPAGRARDDLLTVGLTLDLPLFRGNRQDREVNAAVAREAAARTDRDLLIRELVSRLDAERADQASLAAYNNADGDFAEAVRARIAELDTKIDALTIDVARQQTLARIGYLLTATPAAGI
jgi:outer membrane protein TolC